VIRRSFRIGLVLGLIAGVAFALAKILGPRADDDAGLVTSPTTPWPRLTEDPAVPAPPRERAIPDPATKAPAHLIPDGPAVEEAVVAPEPAPSPAPRKPAAAKKAAAAKQAPAKRKAPAKAWVEPKGTVCPTSHPVKAKLSSKIFHLPGMLNYERTNPDRCYADAKKAEADGLRPAKR
jgi:hypothetical protein